MRSYYVLMFFCLKLFKLFDPLEELLHACLTELLETLRRLYHRPFKRQIRFGIELISIADDLFLKRLRDIADIRWQRQMLGFNLFTRDASARMTLTHEGTALQLVVGMPFIQRAEHPCTKESVTDIGLCAKTLDTGGIAPDDSDIMEHRGFLEKFLVKLQLRMRLGNLPTAVSHLATMHKQYPSEFILRRIKLIYDFIIIHIFCLLFKVYSL